MSINDGVFGGVTIIRPDLHDCATCPAAFARDSFETLRATYPDGTPFLIVPQDSAPMTVLEEVEVLRREADKAEAEIALLNRMVDVLCLRLQHDRCVNLYGTAVCRPDVDCAACWRDYARRQAEEEAG